MCPSDGVWWCAVPWNCSRPNQTHSADTFTEIGLSLTIIQLWLCDSKHQCRQWMSEPAIGMHVIMRCVMEWFNQTIIFFVLVPVAVWKCPLHLIVSITNSNTIYCNWNTNLWIKPCLLSFADLIASSHISFQEYLPLTIKGIEKLILISYSHSEFT